MRFPRLAFRAAAATTAIGLLAGTQLWPASADAGFGPSTGRPFAADSAYNVAVPANPQLDPNSSAMVSYITRTNSATALLYGYGTPVYNATASDPAYRVNCLENWGTCDLEQRSIRIPASAQPTAGSDGSMVVVDFSARISCDFWRARKTSTGWETSWGTCASIDGDGRGPRGGATGAGINLLAGVIRTHEIRNGVINHALSIATDNSCQRVFRYPASKTDGASGRTDCIPEGARLQLDPSINIDAIPGITPGEKAVAKALQKYGAYNRDNSGSPIAVAFEKPTDGNNPYPAAGFGWDYYKMTHIPWKRLRVLKDWQGGVPTPSPTLTAPAPSPTPTAAPSTTPAAPVADTQRPSAPRNLTAGYITSTSARLSWTAATDNVAVTRYQVWRGDGNWSNWTLVGTTTGRTLTFTDTTLRRGTAYTYGIRAFDTAGNKSSSSNIILIRTRW